MRKIIKSLLQNHEVVNRVVVVAAHESLDAVELCESY